MKERPEGVALSSIISDKPITGHLWGPPGPSMENDSGVKSLGFIYDIRYGKLADACSPSAV